MSFKKVGPMPGMEITDEKKEQEEFIENELEPRLKEAKEGNRKVFFADAAHMVRGAFTGYIWCFVKMYLPTPSGRQRLNVLGAIDSITHQLFTIINEKYIDANCVVDLTKEIARQNFSVPITLILDKAKYQRCELVKKWAEYYKT